MSSNPSLERHILEITEIADREINTVKDYEILSRLSYFIICFTGKFFNNWF